MRFDHGRGVCFCECRERLKETGSGQSAVLRETVAGAI